MLNLRGGVMGARATPPPLRRVPSARRGGAHACAVRTAARTWRCIVGAPRGSLVVVAAGRATRLNLGPGESDRRDCTPAVSPRLGAERKR